MGVSTDGIIYYGFDLGEVSFPWSEEWDGVEDWWYFHVYAPEEPIESPFDDHGEWDGSRGFTEHKYLTKDPDQKAALDAYHMARAKHKAACPPVPVKMINVCSRDYPIYAAVVPGSDFECSRGDPRAFSLEDLVVDPGEVEALREFLEIYVESHIREEYDADFELGEPSWYLGSYWG